MNITEELWHNSQLTGILNPNNSSQVTTKGHGLYISAQDGSRYADLRMCKVRSFWGHTHPLEIQEKYALLPELDDNEKSQPHTMKTQAFNSLRLRYTNITLSEFHTLKKTDKEIYIVTINEEDYLNQNSAVHFNYLNQYKSKHHIWLHHDCTLLHTNGNYFFKCNDDFYNQSMQISPAIDFIFLKNQIANTQMNNYAQATHKYIKNIVINNGSGKLSIDHKIIDEFLRETNSKLKRVGHYLEAKQGSLKDISKFRTYGLLIDNNNFIGGSLYFSIPVSCTNCELLDTLNLITKALTEPN